MLQYKIGILRFGKNVSQAYESFTDASADVYTKSKLEENTEQVIRGQIIPNS